MARVAVMPVPSSPDGAVAQVGYLSIDGSVRRQGVGGAKAFYRRLGYAPLYMEMVGSPDPARPGLHTIDR